MRQLAVLVLLCLAVADASVKVTRSSNDGRHPSNLELEVQLPDSSKTVKIPLKRNDQFENVPMTVQSNGVRRTFSSRQVHHASHAHYSDIVSRSVISVREVQGQKQFQGHFMHQGRSFLLQPNKKGHQVKRVPITPQELLEQAKNTRKSLRNVVSRKRRQVAGSATTYVIEIGLCVDYVSYKKLLDMFGSGSVLTELHTYYTHIMTGIDVAFRNIQDPSISIRAVSLHVDTTSSDFECMPPPSTANRLEGSTILEYLKNKKAAMGSSAPDHLMSFTGEDITGGGSSSVCGMAYMGGTCKDIGVSINEDQGLQSWGTAAHELAHNMGSPHDGSGNACDPNDKQLMSPVGGIYDPATVLNSYKFSGCTVSKINNYLATLADGDCLKTSMGSQLAELASSTAEGSRLTLDQVCKLSYPTSPGKFFLTSDAQSTPAAVCAKIYCTTSSGGGTTGSGVRAPAGTSCGNKKSCNWEGKCTDDSNAPSADESCFWGDNFSESDCVSWVNAVKYEQYKSYCPYVQSNCCKTIKNPTCNAGVVC